MKQKKKIFKDYSNVSLGLSLSLGFISLMWIGSLIDEKRGEGHLGVISGMVLGMLYGGYELWKFVKQINDRSNQKKNNEL